MRKNGEGGKGDGGSLAGLEHWYLGTILVVYSRTLHWG
jgi:hypothetical protein